jgi:uncharacterized membrane-anchored protein YitT (DUF2179 family)
MFSFAFNILTIYRQALFNIALCIIAPGSIGQDSTIGGNIPGIYIISLIMLI